jgi:DNA adenine methylase
MTRSLIANATARPFIKWAGGKSQLLPALTQRLPQQFKRYHEPFLGGGAFYFHLYNTGKLTEGATLSDYNPELVLCYQVVRDQLDDLIEALQPHQQNRLDPQYFHEVRSWDRQADFAQRSPVERAARTIYLNRTCYNGLYRLNKLGQFNAPFGYYKNPQICDVDNLRLASQALQYAELRVDDFWQVSQRAQTGDFIYFDPPYVPVSTTASFTTYTGQTFGLDHQQRLADLFNSLQQRGIYGMLSNSSTPITHQLYQANGNTINIVMASRKINSIASKRGEIEEILVCNY